MQCDNCGHEVKSAKHYSCRMKWVDIDYGLRPKHLPAYFPRSHSTVKAVTCEKHNINADDEWAKITDYRMEFYIKWKWGDDWERVCNYPRFSIPAEIKPSEFKGLDWVLAELDKPEVKLELESEKQKRISELKRDISIRARRLEELEKIKIV